MVLDLSRDEVCEYVINAVSDILANANIEYVKWDMNRQLTDMPRLGYNHEYTLGYYKIMSAITENSLIFYLRAAVPAAVDLTRECLHICRKYGRVTIRTQ